MKIKTDPASIIERGRQARALLDIESVPAWFEAQDRAFMAGILDAKDDAERTRLIAEAKAHRALRRLLESTAHAGQQQEKSKVKHGR